MGFRFKKFLSICLSLGLLLSVGSCIFAAAAGNNTNGKKITEYSVGDILEFGWYPQSKVEDSDTISELNSLAGDNSTWTSYGYYSGDGERFNGNMTVGNWMRYIDVVYGSNKYRGVVFDSYRPRMTGLTLSELPIQSDNGYYKGEVYWFVYEPIKWRVLDPQKGIVLSEIILDSQPFNNYSVTGDYNYMLDEEEKWADDEHKRHSNCWGVSSVRSLLINEFYETAFSSEQQDCIVVEQNDDYDYFVVSPNTRVTDHGTLWDDVYLLTYEAAMNEDYGFGTDESRCAIGSDYAKCQGLNCSEAYSPWMLQDMGYYYNTIFGVQPDGSLSPFYYIDLNNMGVRPAINFDDDSEIIQTEMAYVANGEITITETSTVKISGNGMEIYVVQGQLIKDVASVINENVEIININEKPVSDKEKIASGMKVVLKDKDGKILDEKTIIVLGDVGGDGEIAADDARTALRASVGLDTLNEWQALAANVDGENEIEASDARLILRASVGLDTFSV